MTEHHKIYYSAFFKPLFDRFLALFGLMVSMPILAVMAAGNLMVGLPVFFYQKRPGRQGKGFMLYKICTMHPHTGGISRYSQLLRVLSLDELPQLYNILLGEMSFIGPRPLLEEYLELYDENMSRRHEVLPGITGWAQVHGRNDIPLSEKVELDLFYVDHQSLKLDCLIFWKTIRQIFKLDQADGHGFSRSDHKKSLS